MLIFLTLVDTQEEKDKFTALYEKYRYFMWYLANQILNDYQLAEDAVQDSFLVLTKHLNKVDSVDSPQTKRYLATIAKSRAIDILRKKGRLEDPSSEVPENDASDSRQADLLDELIVKEGYEYLLSCIRSLDESYRTVLECRYLHQMSEKETALFLNVAPKTVNVRIFRARKKLQEMLAPSSAIRS